MTKDYFTALEAADYACVPLADFEAQADACGVLSFQYMGQRVYRKADLQASMERAWRLSSGWAVALPSTAKRARGVGRASDMFSQAEADGARTGSGSLGAITEAEADGV